MNTIRMRCYSHRKMFFVLNLRKRLQDNDFSFLEERDEVSFCFWLGLDVAMETPFVLR